MSDSIPQIDYRIFTPTGNDAGIIALMEHIASGAQNRWCVYWDSGSFPTDSFEEANAKFDRIVDGHNCSLVLYTRIGTAVAFRYKE